MGNHISAKPFGKQYKNAMLEHATALGLSKLQRAVLNVLLDHINYESGQSRPGRERIKNRSGYTSDRSIDHALKFLRDAAIIVPLAYLGGGRGCATCYGFCLPAWDGNTTANAAGVNSDAGNQYPRKANPIPPQSTTNTPAKDAVPTERTIITGERNNAGRIGEGPFSKAERALRFSQLHRLHGMDGARSMLEQEEALRAAGD